MFERFKAFGFVDCSGTMLGGRGRLPKCPCDEGDACVHVQTHRHSKSDVPWHLDYIFASDEHAKNELKTCRAIDGAWGLSDHCPVIAEFEW